MDDSTSAELERNKTTVEKYRHRLKIIHKEGAGKHLRSMADRIREGTIAALKDIDTEYFSFSSDDDFQLPKFVHNAILELEKDPTIASVHGPEVKVYFDKTGQHQKSRARPWSSNNFADPLDRLYNYVHELSLIYQGVCRKKCLEIFDTFFAQNGRNLYSRETTGFNWYDIEVVFVAHIHMAANSKYLPTTIMNIRLNHHASDRIENLHKASTPDEWTVGPIFSLCKPDLSHELQRSVDNLKYALKMFGSKYSDTILDFATYRILWAIMTGSKDNIIHPDTVYFSYRSGTNCSKRHQKRFLRLLKRKRNTLLARTATLRDVNVKKFIKEIDTNPLFRAAINGESK